VVELNIQVEIVIVCGHNQLLYRRFEELARHLPASSYTKLHVVGFVNMVEQYMQAADLIVGKAGPNTLFESVATRTPFLAVTHVHGQEDGNLDIIREYHLGYVQEDQHKALELIKDIIEHPEQLKQFEKPIQKLAEYNQQAGEKLKKVVLKRE
jgi:UDP-N-acetylglucosamine:LPS N-acetylglucosamine transferase